jgi:gluconate kinase
MVKFPYNNTMHSTTQQTPFFANHGLHPRFDIQGVNDVVNPTIEDRVTWLTNIQTQLVSNLEEVQR